MMNDLRLLIVEDSRIMRDALEYLFESVGAEHLIQAATCQEALFAVRHKSPDVVLLDLSLPDGHGLSLLEQFGHINSSLPVLIHSCQYNPRLLWRSYRLGARGFFLKGESTNALIRAVVHTPSGDSLWTSEQLRQIREFAETCEVDDNEVRPPAYAFHQQELN